ncbi:MAG: thiol:disulfide oxidoreductase TlpB [Flavipsychrobacter sp.]|jgi:glutaredoxin|nr:thiol:disulfide oxidoreductase TlpB [Flavipsychrobacter sp.]
MDPVSPAPKGILFYIKRTLGAILLLALATTFLYSAYTKSGVELKGFYLVDTPGATNAFDSFQWTFLDLGINSMLAAGIIARIMIGLELLLGLFLLFHIYLRQFTYKAVIAILIIFIAYLLVIMLKQGNTGNCGCFGNKITMTPSQAIWKNAAMITAAVLLMFIYPVKPYKFQEYVCMALCAASFSVPFAVNNIYIGTSPVKYSSPINLEPLYKYEPKPTVELRQGKHIIAFMSLTCPHCKKAAKLMHIIHQQHPDIPLFMVLAGNKDHKKQFFDETHAEKVPYLHYPHNEEFEEMINSGLKKGEHNGVPTIYWVNNSVIEYKSVYAYYQLDPKYMVEWMHANPRP